MDEIAPISLAISSFLRNIDVAWTATLLMVRCIALFIVLPGIGSARQMSVRSPIMFLLGVVFAITSPRAEIPTDFAMMALQVVSEFSLGFLLGIVPYFIITGVQTGAQLASTTMGLSASNLIDPSTGTTTSDLSRLLGDICIILFLGIGGHHAVLYAASGLGGEIVPGSYLVTERSLDLLVDRSAMIFKIGLLVSAPVLVALLLTNFVMGLISKMVPSVNIFMVSFPLTIGIGLLLTIFALPDLVVVVKQHFVTMEDQLLTILSDTVRVSR